MNEQVGRHDERELELAPGVVLPRRELRYAFARARGPGGQAVNKLSTKAQLRVAVSSIKGLDPQAATRLRRLAGRRLTQEDDVLIEAQTHRSQLDNKLQCIERLRELVRQAMIKPTQRKKKKPTRAMIERRLQGKRRTSEKKALRRGRRDGAE